MLISVDGQVTTIDPSPEAFQRMVGAAIDAGDVPVRSQGQSIATIISWPPMQMTMRSFFCKTFQFLLHLAQREIESPLVHLRSLKQIERQLRTALPFHMLRLPVYFTSCLTLYKLQAHRSQARATASVGLKIWLLHLQP